MGKIDLIAQHRLAARSLRDRRLGDRRLVVQGVGRPPCLSAVALLCRSPLRRSRMEAKRWRPRWGDVGHTTRWPDGRSDNHATRPQGGGSRNHERHHRDR